jgi:hypothetical protein
MAGNRFTISTYLKIIKLFDTESSRHDVPNFCLFIGRRIIFYKIIYIILLVTVFCMLK